jgi:hypothetical protein
MFRSQRGLYRKRALLRQPLGIILMVVVSILALELLVRCLAMITGQSDELTAYEGERKIINAYRLKFLDAHLKPYDGFPNQGKLLAKRSVLLGYQLLANQQSEFWQINEQGFRNHESVPVAKPKGEIRIFLLGGATAFGQLSVNNQSTITGQLEQQLNQSTPTQTSPPRYRVINAAVPGYASGNVLAQLALEILPYDPDLIVILNGYEDLMLPSTYDGAEIPQIEVFLHHSTTHFFEACQQDFKNWSTQSYLLKSILYWLIRPHEASIEDSANQLSLVAQTAQTPLAQRLADHPQELQNRMQRYYQNLQQIAFLSKTKQVPLIIALQPEITGRGEINPVVNEQKMLKQFGKAYPQKLKAGYLGLEKALNQVEKEFPTTVTGLNFYNLFDEDFRNQAFQDAVHLTDIANKALAERLSESIQRSLQSANRQAVESGEWEKASLTP